MYKVTEINKWYVGLVHGRSKRRWYQPYCMHTSIDCFCEEQGVLLAGHSSHGRKIAPQKCKIGANYDPKLLFLNI